MQRHSVLIDRKTGEEYLPLRNLSAEQERFLPYDSALSEFAAVGFEYGYSVANPDALVMWEAQFGDFVNGAQSVIDEFISSGEAKWGQHSRRRAAAAARPRGPGAGPHLRPHRAVPAAVRRGLDDRRACPSTPANYFHLLRRHALDGVRRPLVVFTPKSMLRNRAVVSPLSDFTGGRFRSVIDDPRYRETDGPAAGVRTRAAVQRQALLRAGRRPRQARGSTTPRSCGSSSSTRCRTASSPPSSSATRTPTDVRWVQEEPANQGAWPFFGLELPEKLPERLAGLKRVSRRRWPPRRRVVEGARGRAGRHHRRRRSHDRSGRPSVYATDRGIEELLERRGEETVSVEWLADRLRAFVDLNPAFEDAVERVASFLARDDED